MVENNCLENNSIIFNEIINCLQQLDLKSIAPETPIASGVIDLLEINDPFAKLLSNNTKQILSHHDYNINEFLEQINIIITEFVNSYKDLGPNFDPALMKPISFPYKDIPIETQRILMTCFDLLEAL